MIRRLRSAARRLRQETLALYLAARDPRTPWHARILVTGVVAYALSPIDLIPDFLPVIGYVDDLILVPVGIMVAVRMIPEHVLAQCRIQAAQSIANPAPSCRTAAIVIVCIWIVGAIAAGLWLLDLFA